MPDSSSAPPGAVFLSYSREDSDVARRLADALRAFGMEVWFDQNELRGGDSWDAKIRTQIRTCSLFVAIISENTQARGEGYFRREWKLAVERTHDMAAGVAFLLPVVSDDTAESEALVPEEFMRVQWTRLAHGMPTPQFVEHVKRLLERPAKASPAKKSAPATHAAPAAAAKSGIPGWAWGVLGAIVVGVAVFLVTRRSSEPPAPAPVAAPAPKPVVAAPVAPVISDKSIAVLPFTNMSEEKDSGFFADGIHEDILTNLALVRQLHVVSRTSVMQYRATTKSIRQIGEELGVAYVLEGSVRRAGSKVRVTGQLINARTDEHVWAKAYDRDITDIFGIQAELSQEIAGALSAALTPQEKSLLDRRPTDNLAAYDAYVKARRFSGSVNLKDLNECERLLQQAVQLDPKFAAAWATMGSLNAFQYFGGSDHTDERLDKAKAAIDTAVRLAPDAPEVIENLGDYYYYAFRDYTRAVEQYERLAVLRPNDGVVYGSLGLIHRRQGRFKEAMAEFRRAVQLEPRSMKYVRSLAETAQFLCLYDEALPMMRRAAELADHEPTVEAQIPLIPFTATGSTKEGEEWLARIPPEQAGTPTMIYLRKAWAVQIGDFSGYVTLDRQQRYADTFGEAKGIQDTTAAFVLAALGDKAAARQRAGEAVSDLKSQLEKQPANEILWTNLGLAYAVLGERAESLRCAQKAMDLVPESKDAIFGPNYTFNCAVCLAWLGDKDRALAELARLLRTPRGENIYMAKASASWFPLRGDPRFEALVNDPKNNAPML